MRSNHWMNAVVVLLIFGVAFSAALRRRAEPNDWFSAVVAEDAAAHDASGIAASRPDALCFQRVAFNEDPTLALDDLRHVQVPYNYWWRRGSMMLSISHELDAPAERLLSIGEHGITLDFRQHSRVYVRIQCAFPCCLEAVELLAPEGAQPLVVRGANLTHTVAPRPVKRTTVPPGWVVFNPREPTQQMTWSDTRYERRIDRQTLCDHSTEGTWLEIDSPSRIEATLVELDMCFVHHAMDADWDTHLCSEIVY